MNNNAQLQKYIHAISQVLSKSVNAQVLIVETNNGQPHIIISCPSRQSSIQWYPRIPYFVFNPLRNLLFTKEDISVETQNEPLLGDDDRDDDGPSTCEGGLDPVCYPSGGGQDPSGGGQVCQCQI